MFKKKGGTLHNYIEKKLTFAHVVCDEVDNKK
jgi:hypothetical protein